MEKQRENHFICNKSQQKERKRILPKKIIEGQAYVPRLRRVSKTKGKEKKKEKYKKEVTLL